MLEQPVARRSVGGFSVVVAVVGVAEIGRPQPDDFVDRDTWIARFGQLSLLAQPGERWLYNAGAHVLSVLCARAAGTLYDEVLRTRIFQPLGMRDTAFTLRTSSGWRLRTSQLLEPRSRARDRGRLAQEVLALRPAGREPGRDVVCLGGGCAVAGQLEQVTADRWNAVAGRQAPVLLLGQQSRPARALVHRERDRAVQRETDGVGGDLLEQLVQWRDLAPVGLGRARRLGVDGRDWSAPPTSRIGRTPIGANRGFGHFAAISTARSLVSQSTTRSAAEVFLGLGKQPVRDHRRAVGRAHYLRPHRVGERLSRDELARLPDSSSNPSISSIRSLRDENISRMSSLSYRRSCISSSYPASSHPAVADVRRQWGMENLGGLEIELGDAVE